jgi:hypothetical protein
MGFDLIRLVALTEQHGVVARTIVAASKGLFGQTAKKGRSAAAHWSLKPSKRRVWL